MDIVWIDWVTKGVKMVVLQHCFLVKSRLKLFFKIAYVCEVNKSVTKAPLVVITELRYCMRKFLVKSTHKYV